MSRQLKSIAALTVLCLAGIGSAAATGSGGSDGSPAVASQAPAPAGQFWQKVGNATWTADGLLTSSAPDASQPFGVSFGGARLRGTTLPTTNPQEITALSYDFKANRSGAGGGSARLAVCFSDGPACNSYAELGPREWTADVWTHVDGFAPSDGVNNTWINGGRFGSCDYEFDITWSQVVACHPGASITEILVVNDSGWLYTAGEQVILNNLTANHVTASAEPPVLAESATVIPVKGRVLVRRRGAKRYRRARTPVSLQFGGVINAEDGRVRLVAAKRKGRQRGSFRGGKFRLGQRSNGLVAARLRGAVPGCDDTLAVTSRRRKRRRLWSTAKGKFRTAGRHGAATVRGTKWLTVDRCDGTFFRVTRGAIRVRDFARNKTVVVRAGETYVAKKKKRR